MSSTTSVIAGRMFDGRVFVERPTRVEILGGRIASVSPADRAGDDGLTLLPGLIDAHCHAARVGLFEPDERPSPTSVAGNVLTALERGVTTLGDMGCTPAMARALRALGDARADAPAVVSSGPVLADPLGYPLDWMRAFHRRVGAVIPCGSERAARDAVERVAASGMNHVKLCIMHKSYAYQPLRVFPRSVAKAIVDEAHRLGLRAFAHAHFDADYRLALDAGVDALMHSSFDPLDADTVARVRDAGIPVCATLWVFHSACLGAEQRWHRDARRTASVPGPVRRSWRRFAEAYAASGDVLPAGIAGGLPKDLAREGVRNALANLALLHDAKVPITYGSDGPYGFSVLGRASDELRLMHGAGLDVEACLGAATSAAAALLGLGDRGRIEPGLRADLVLIEGDPREDLGALDRVREVWRSGERVTLSRGARARALVGVLRGLGSTLAEAVRAS